MGSDRGVEVRRHRSVSQLLKYADCSEQYRLLYVDKVSNFTPAAWLAQGTAFHHAVQGWEESGRSPQFDISHAYVVKYDEEIERFKERVPELARWAKSPKTKTEDDISNRRKKGLEQLQNYVDFCESETFVIKDIDDWTLAVEMEFEIIIGDILIKGAVDQILLLPDGVEVRDLKTGNREQANIQLGVYAYAVEKIFGWPVRKASYYYAKDNKIVTLSEKDLSRYSESYLSDLFNALEKGIQNEIFIPNPGDSCFFCPVKDNCREVGKIE